MDGSSSQDSLYRRLLGARFDGLPPAVRRLHQPGARFEAAGECRVQRGDNSVARILADSMGMPPAAEHLPLRFSIDCDGGAEIWRRDFGGHVFTSRMWAEKGVLCERTPLATLRYDLEVEHGILRMQLRRFSGLGLPLPRGIWPTIATAESERDGRYCFDVRASMPGIGLVVRYKGWLVQA
ncbi:MAG TPA: DUF4166 domain-containing protein [Nevskia sp.]|nr:DUF4166 domain-containing protein [Nevskia sp.]